MVAGGLGDPYAEEAGIPQGDPLSMFFAAIILRPWAAMMEDTGVSPYLHVDGLLTLSNGDGYVEKLRMQQTRHTST